MDCNNNYRIDGDLDDQVAAPSSIQKPGFYAHQNMDVHPIHPRHPKASFHRPDVTQDLGLEHKHPSNDFVSPWPHASNDSTMSWASPVVFNNERAAISKPALDPNWPLTQSPAEFSWENDPHRPPPTHPQQPHRVAPQSHHLPLTPDQSSHVPQTPIHLRKPDQIYKYVSYPHQSPGRLTSSEYTFQDFDDSPRTSTSTPPVKRISNLGPPSSRRGRSMLYSTPSFVSPIVEEKLSTGSRSSYASSAAMPDSRLYGNVAIGEAVRGLAQYDNESMTDGDGDWIIDQYGDERSIASGAPYREDPLLAASMSQPHLGQRHGEHLLPPPVDPFNGGSVFMDLSSDSSNTFTTQMQTPETTPATERNLTSPPHMMSSPLSPPNLAELSGSPQPPNRLHIMKRPPRLDIDSVRAAESRGSLTSLPDLILRATRLADLIDKGKRPSSRLDDLDQFDEKSSIVVDNHRFDMLERRKSGLSDMLASFPPPVHSPQNGQQRDSLFWTGSWPMLPSVRDQDGIADDDSDVSIKKGKQARRCCGFPAWAFVLIPLLVFCLIIVIVLPLELGQKHSSGMTLGECQKSLTCLHGGTNVVFQNTCSCICTNGFTGSTCNIGGSEGCITTNLVATDGSSRINNVTLGRAVPRVIAESAGNFSIPLSATAILAKFNAANLSCIAQNSLVTFDGQYTARLDSARVVTRDESSVSEASEDPELTPAASLSPTSGVSRTSLQTKTGSGSPTSSDGPASTATFVVTEKILDFARTVVLYVLQEESIESASDAQALLQQFFSQANLTQSQNGSSATVQDASNLSIGGNNTVDLVTVDVSIGQGSVVHPKSFKRDVVTASWSNPGSLAIVDRPENYAR